MFRKLITLAGLCLALATVPASAQGPSYESRGYGGPLYVGPNFQQGGQWSPPSYGPGQSSSRERATSKSYNEDTPRRARNAAKNRNTPTQDADTEKPAATAKANASDTTADTENSTIAGGPLPGKANAVTDAKTEPASKALAADTENSTITSAALADTDAASKPGRKAEASAKTEPASTAPVTCKRYFATVGQTIDVPCD